MMKLAAALAFVCAPAVAFAERPSDARTSYDIAVMATKIDVGGQSVPGKLVRFGPRIVIRNMFEVGCDLDIGTVAGDAPVPAIARGTSGGTLSSSIEGRISAAKIMAGGYWSAGAFAAGAGLAVGLHAAELEDGFGRPVDDLWPAPIAEGRTHLDAWISPHLTLGLAASMDLSQRHDVSLGVVLGLHPVAR